MDKDKIFQNVSRDKKQSSKDVEERDLFAEEPDNLDDLIKDIFAEELAATRQTTKRKKANTLKLKNYSPKEIVAYLDDNVIGQDSAKRTLAVAVYNHMKRIQYYEKHKNDGIDIQKTNVLMVGPSGSGKTYLLQNLAKLFDVPFAIADATSLTESGYVGADVETVLQKLYNAADGDLNRVEKGIVFIDEIDKKAGKNSENSSITRDVSGEGVQQALLKLIEGSVVEVQLTGARRHPYGDTVEIDTSNILFIVGGAFPGIEKIIEKRLKTSKNTMGISLTNDSKASKSSNSYNKIIEQVTHEDLRQFGMIPEFLGRMPVICPLKELNEDELCKIITEPRSSILKQYQTLLAEDNIKLNVEKEALQTIANMAIKNNTGARGLRSILEKYLRDVMFELPGSLQGRYEYRVNVTKDCILNNAKPEIKKCLKQNKSA